MKWIVSMLFAVGMLAGMQAHAAGVPDPVTSIIADQPATVVGQSATQLPDGDWLLLGGGENREVSSAGYIVNAQGKLIKKLGDVLHHARSGLTATLLPDGSVLVLGGVDAKGAPIADAEQYFPSTGKCIDLGSLDLVARSGQTATLLQDGTLLIAGGIGEKGQPIAQAELLNTDTLTAISAPGVLNTPRSDQVATLLSTDDVLLWGGIDNDQKPVSSGEVYDFTARTFSNIDANKALILARSVNGPADPEVVASLPASGATAFAVNGRLVVRFSKRLNVASLNTNTVTLIGPSGTVAVNVVGAEEGMLLFVTPQQDLMPDTNYTLFIDGAADKGGKALPFTAVGFTTESLSGKSPGTTGGAVAATGSTSANGTSAQGSSTNSTSTSSASGSSSSSETSSTGTSMAGSSTDSEDWIPNEHNFHGFWMTGRKRSKLQDQPALKARAGVTAVAGQVLTLNGNALPNVTLTIGNHSVRTDRTGRFLLRHVSSGKQTLDIDATTADHGSTRYGYYQVLVPVQAGKTNVLSYTIWMTMLDSSGDVTIPSPTTKDMVITTPNIPGLELHIPAGTVIKGRDGKIVTHLNITAIPVDRPPFPLPHFGVPTYFTVQPGGAVLLSTNGKTEQGARLVYPNFTNQSPGSRMTFWNYDAHVKGWYPYGRGTVSPDGKQVIPDPGVAIYEFTGAMDSLPSNGTKTGSPKNNYCNCGDPVNAATGLFTNNATDLVVKDTIPLVLSRSYRPQDNTVRAFGIGTNMSYDYFMVGTSYDTTSTVAGYTYQDLILPDGSHIHFQRITPGTTLTYNTIYENTTTPGKFYGAKLTYSGAGCPGASWTITEKNGTKIYFPESMGSNLWAKAAPLCLIDRYGNELTFTRDSNHNLTQVTSPNGRYIKFTYDGANRIIQAADNMGRTVSYTYDAGGRLATVTDPAGNVESYNYDLNNNMISVVDKKGVTKVRNQYDSNGRVAKQTYADGTSETFSYSVKDNAYIEAILSICEGDPVSTQIGTYGDYPVSCTAGPDGRVYQTDVTDGRGIVTRFEFNNAGYPTSVTQAFGTPLAQTTTYVRDPISNAITSMTDPLGRVTNYTYDSLGNLLSITRNAGTQDAATTSFTYDATYNQLTSVTDPLGHTTTITLDSTGSPIKVTDANGNTMALGHDAAGLVTSITNALGNITKLNYNGGDLSQIIDPLSNTTNINTDAIGRTTQVTDPLGNRIGINHDLLNRVDNITNPLDQQANFRYDPNDNLTSVVDAKGHVTSFSYDTLNYPLTNTDPLGQTSSLTYDADHNVITSTDRKGQVTHYAYDSLNRLSSITYADGSTETFTYDAGNRVTQIVDSADGTLSFTYDDFDRVTQVTSATGTVNYTYYANGLRHTMTVNGQPTLTYNYDAGNRLISIVQAAGTVNGNVPQTTSFSYDAANRRIKTTLPNSVSENYSYDADNRVTGITYLHADGTTVIGTLTYAYDADGRRIDMGGTLAAANDLATGTTSTSYDADNRLTSWGGANLSYDADGNLTSDGVSNYTWNARNQLTQITDIATGTVVASFTYDPLGRRQSKTIGGATSQYLYDGPNIVQELDGSGGFVANYLSGGIDEWFARQSATGTDSYLTDGLGSTIMILDGSGTQLVRYTYDAYGNTTANAAYPNPFQYAGRENDGDGFYYYRARYYSPAYQRFISSDPTGLGGGINTYAYVGENPISYTDPFGLARLGRRPLVPFDFMINSPFLAKNHIDVSHEAIFFEDGKQPSNLGWYEDSEVRPDDPQNIPKYTMFGPHYDDATMRLAVAIVRKNMKQYHLFGNNCQDFVALVLKEYKLLRKNLKKCHSQ